MALLARRVQWGGGFFTGKHADGGPRGQQGMDDLDVAPETRKEQCGVAAPGTQVYLRSRGQQRAHHLRVALRARHDQRRNARLDALHQVHLRTRGQQGAHDTRVPIGARSMQGGAHLVAHIDPRPPAQQGVDVV